MHQLLYRRPEHDRREKGLREVTAEEMRNVMLLALDKLKIGITTSLKRRMEDTQEHIEELKALIRGESIATKPKETETMNQWVEQFCSYFSEPEREKKIGISYLGENYEKTITIALALTGSSAFDGLKSGIQIFEDVQRIGAQAGEYYNPDVAWLRGREIVAPPRRHSTKEKMLRTAGAIAAEGLLAAPRVDDYYRRQSFGGKGKKIRTYD
ncbi:MAG: hypothetical protein V1857_06405 [archaeon]